jgi:deferrochelatase/peroxidase EfeB
VQGLACAAAAERSRGPEISVALGLTSAVFVGRLAARRPRQLRPMPTFPGDVPGPGRHGVDALVQVGAATVAAARRGLDDVVARAGAVVTWRADLGRPDNAVRQGRALTRNVLGFAEGHTNPDARRPRDVDDVVLTGPSSGEPGWAVGGSYLVARVLTASLDLWDVDAAVQERVIGRRRDGGWLDGRGAFEQPDFAADPDGALTPLDSHVRRANPRDGRIPPPRLLRRGWTYTGGDRRDEIGLLFVCYQADLATGFDAVQHRLAGEALDRYVLATGGGYFYLPPDRPWIEELLA